MNKCIFMMSSLLVLNVGSVFGSELLSLTIDENLSGESISILNVLKSEVFYYKRKGELQNALSTLDRIANTPQLQGLDNFFVSNHRALWMYALEQQEEEESHRSQSPFLTLTERQNKTNARLQKEADRRKERETNVLNDTSPDGMNTRHLQILLLTEAVHGARTARTVEQLLSLPNLEEELSQLRQKLKEIDDENKKIDEVRKRFDELKKREDKFYKYDEVHLENIVVDPAMSILELHMHGLSKLDISDFQMARHIFNHAGASHSTNTTPISFDEYKKAFPNENRDAFSRYKTALDSASSISFDEYQEILKRTGVVQKIESVIQILNDSDLISEATLSLNKILPSVGYLEGFFDKISVIIPWVESMGETATQRWLMGSFVSSARAFENLGLDKVSCPKGICERLVLGISWIQPTPPRENPLHKILLAGRRKEFFLNLINNGNPQFVRNFLEMNYENSPGARDQAKAEWVTIHQTALQNFCIDGMISIINQELASYGLSEIDAEKSMPYLNTWKGFMKERIEINAFFIDWEEVFKKDRKLIAGFDSQGVLKLSPLQ